MGKTDLGAFSRAEGWKHILQLLREQSKKMEKLAKAFSATQQGRLINNPGYVKSSVKEATEVLSGMLNIHKCLLESEILEDRIPKKGKGSTSPTRAAATESQTPQKYGK